MVSLVKMARPPRYRQIANGDGTRSRPATPARRLPIAGLAVKLAKRAMANHHNRRLCQSLPLRWPA